eukprot:GHVL01014378.1.p1 GENE.GHVL01014378.1~~GHVL01014378.1.p1  ORF type:complete len:285 (+),score=52.77 GHVL01014378.1:796-1650(+)
MKSSETPPAVSRSLDGEFLNFPAPMLLPNSVSRDKPGVYLIQPSVVAQLISGEYENINFAVFDCRFDYEFEGGHIKGAISASSPAGIEKTIFHPSGEAAHDKNTVFIFHCEFSHQRGPHSYREIRKIDRKKNTNLSYPEMYVMSGGYKRFFNEFPTLCTPEGYIPMDHPKHSQACRVKLSEFQNSKNDISKRLSKPRLRAHTSEPLLLYDFQPISFGEKSPDVRDTPNSSSPPGGTNNNLDTPKEGGGGLIGCNLQQTPSPLECRRKLHRYRTCLGVADKIIDT